MQLTAMDSNLAFLSTKVAAFLSWCLSVCMLLLPISLVDFMAQQVQICWRADVLMIQNHNWL